MNAETANLGTDKTQNTFEIGLCMAGAISAGAYIAGVVDFLVEALSQWDKAKEEARKTAGADEQKLKELILLHDVKIKCLSGASAGGLTASAIAVGMLTDFDPIRALYPGQHPGRGNLFYDCWVREPDFAPFLELADLPDSAHDPAVRSLLDCTWLTGLIAQYMKPPSNPGNRKPFLTDPMHLFLSVANMRGVPYSITFGGSDDGHGMMRHEDYFQFVLGNAPWNEHDALGETPIVLNPGNSADLGWRVMRTAAQGSSAIPMVLVNQVLSRSHQDYDDRWWDLVDKVSYDPATKRKTSVSVEKPIQPDWRQWGREYVPSYKTMLMDGGTFNNEPFELARRSLAGKWKFNPRNAKDARRAVIMVDPFPGIERDDIQTIQDYEKQEVHWQLFKLMSAWKAQARFKPQEIDLALKSDVFSRFLITPSRTGAAELGQSPIACGIMGGFGGFLSDKFRQHDFMLGRRNCQRFLTNHFCIPLEEAPKNNLFDRNEGTLDMHAEVVTDDTGSRNVIPLIPLCGSARREVTMDDLPWHSLKYDKAKLDPLMNDARRRLQRIGGLYVKKVGLPGFVNWCAGKLLNWLVYGKIIDKVRSWAENDMRRNGLI